MITHPPKYPSTPHWPWSQKVHRDDSYHEEPEFFLGKRVVITEKLDGGNTCLWNGNVYARSTTLPAGDGWFAMVKKHHAWKTHSTPWMALYGEDLYGIHSIEYGPVHEDQTYRMFASRHFDETYDRFMDWDETFNDSEIFDLPLVPIRFTGTFYEVDAITKWFEKELQKPSELGGPCEGFVMRTWDGFDAVDFRRHVCKYVRANHVQTDEHWTKNWKPCPILERGEQVYGKK